MKILVKYFILLISVILFFSCKPKQNQSEIKNIYDTTVIKDQFIWQTEQTLYHAKSRSERLKSQFDLSYEQIRTYANRHYAYISCLRTDQIRFNINSLASLLYNIIDEIEFLKKNNPSSSQSQGTLVVKEVDLALLQKHLIELLEPNRSNSRLTGLVTQLLSLIKDPQNQSDAWCYITKESFRKYPQIFSNIFRKLDWALKEVNKWKQASKGACKDQTCSDVNDKTDCEQAAQYNGFSQGSAALICSNLTPWTTSCIRNVADAGLDFSLRKRLCKDATKERNQCIVMTGGLGILESTIEALCSEPNEWTGPCTILARDLDFPSRVILQTCKKANQETITCLQESQAERHTRYQAEEKCSY